MFIMLCSFLVFVILILNANLSAPCIEMLMLWRVIWLFAFIDHTRECYS